MNCHGTHDTLFAPGQRMQRAAPLPQPAAAAAACRRRLPAAACSRSEGLPWPAAAGPLPNSSCGHAVRVAAAVGH